MKLGHGQLGNHIIMVLLRIIICFFKTLVRLMYENSNVSEFKKNMFDNSNIHRGEGMAGLYEKY